ncbi:MAG: DedA family protein [Hymenobacteraceae bacterium]|nr:DedA family protein [Hymenobacteraceae bacterium]
MVDLFRQFVEIILHLDVHLRELTQQYGGWTYAILFAIIFTETGVVLFPFLPGDSLLFVAGSLAALHDLELGKLIGLLFVAAVLGDNLNFAIGNYIGPRAFSGRIPLLKREYLDQTQAFYAKHGGKTLIMARFVPIIRTFAPFVAGVGTMKYGRFLLFSLVGGSLWVGSLTLLGYFTGNIPVVKNNFTYLIYGIILLSILPPALTAIRGMMGTKKAV